jgi:four helix bundle protein
MALEDIKIYALILQMVAESDRVCSVTKSRRDFDLADQLSRAALSVGNNFAEGYGRSATGERLMLMFYAEGSVQECKNCLRVAVSRNHISAQQADAAIATFGRISIGIIEFCASILRDDPDYKGSYRERVSKRRAWRQRRR